MQRLDRLSAILIQLQSRKLLTAQAIADRFDISKRTVYRDIKSLQAAGVPIGIEEGKGYFLVEGYRLPPVHFTPEEANAFVTVEKMLNYHTEGSLHENFRSGLDKILAVLRQAEKTRAEFLDERIGYPKRWLPRTVFLSEIQFALTELRVVHLTYQAKDSQEITQRDFCPYGVYFNGVVWTTMGFCRLRQALREFRLDRVMELQLKPETFEPDPTFRMDSYLEARAKRFF
ncbi:MAG TPA: DNA-binding transcriptional regulator [Cytophagales bacterium]|nr:DNA-binding transcriptional regulator [Cytophagales bacterium]HAP61028.1 DNA-binding transcriptional regulator [Cytophagales bacterium]